jgi:hypothetical protein
MSMYTQGAGYWWKKNSGSRSRRAPVWTRSGSGLHSIGPGLSFFISLWSEPGLGPKFLFFSGPGPKKRVPAVPQSIDIVSDKKKYHLFTKDIVMIELFFKNT